MPRRATERPKLSARAHSRIQKSARAIADLTDTPQIEPPHLAEALQFRKPDRGAGP